jgi:hypothetical protein
MLKIKEKFLGRRIVKGNTIIILSNDLTQKELLWIKNVICESFIEEKKVIKKSKKK